MKILLCLLALMLVQTPSWAVNSARWSEIFRDTNNKASYIDLANIDFYNNGNRGVWVKRLTSLELSNNKKKIWYTVGYYLVNCQGNLAVKSMTQYGLNHEVLSSDNFSWLDWKMATPDTLGADIINAACNVCTDCDY